MQDVTVWDDSLTWHLWPVDAEVRKMGVPRKLKMQNGQIV